MKKILFIVLLIFLSISSLNASTYSDWEHISVDELPNASSDTINYIYDYNNKYYITNVVAGAMTKYEVGDSISHIYFYDDNLQNTLSDYLYTNNLNSAHHDHCFFTLSDSSSCYDLYYQSLNNSGISLYGSRANSQAFNQLLIRPSYGYTFQWLDSNTLHFYSSYAFGTIAAIFPYANNDSFSQYISSIIYKSLSDTSYEWVEISYYDWYDLPSPTESDYYLFFTYTDIIDFDVFNWVDFTSFSDYQKLTITLAVNLFYLCFLGFCVYIFIKSINKLFSMLF